MTSSALILKYFEANFLNAVSMALQMGLKGRQHLTQFSRRRIGVHQKAPFCAVNRPGLNGISQGSWDQVLQRFETKAGLPGELCQARQTGRFLCRFHEGEGLIDFCHPCIMREP